MRTGPGLTGYERLSGLIERLAGWYERLCTPIERMKWWIERSRGGYERLSVFIERETTAKRPQRKHDETRDHTWFHKIVVFTRGATAFQKKEWHGARPFDKLKEEF